MTICKAQLKRKGQGLVEYGLILVLIAIAVVLILTVVGTQINNTFSRVGSALPMQP
jgi:pilus assembly protein Flp/PilA